MIKNICKSALAILCTIFFCSNSPAEDIPSPAMDARVKELIEHITEPGKQTQIFAELEDLGVPGVPYIIKYMNDRRPLPFHTNLELKNSASNAFEATRQYGPKQVVDALAAILNQITGESFGLNPNEATEIMRDKEVLGWCNYLKQIPAPKNTSGKHS